MSRTLVLFTLAITSSVTTATLFAVFVAPLEKVYGHGYEAGQHAATYVADQADERAVIGGRRASGPRVVIPIRALQPDRFRS
jgi:hypothetical protein